MKKISTVIACKRNRFYFWNSCKRLQNFVNVEALLQVVPFLKVAGQLGLKSQLGPGSTLPGVFSEHSATYMMYDQSNLAY